MQQSGLLPDHCTYTIALKACADLRALSTGIAIHNQMKQTAVTYDMQLLGALVHMYATCGDFETAETI